MSYHFRIFCVVLLCTIGTTPLFAQLSSFWSPIDTLTEGAYDDCHPSVAHNVMAYAQSGDNYWVIFERHTTSTSEVVGRRFLVGPGVWDRTDYVISSEPSDSLQLLPDLGEARYWDTTNHEIALTAWQRWDGKHWQIWYSETFDSSSSWSSPVALTDDTLDNTSVQVRNLQDSTLVLIWKRGTDLVSLRITPSTVSALETLGGGGSNAFEYDVVNTWGRFQVVWTLDSTRVMSRVLSVYPVITWSDPLVIDAGINFSRLHLFLVPMSGESFLCDAKSGTTRDVYLVRSGGSESAIDLSNDSLADDIDAVGYSIPVITKRNAGTTSSFVPFDALVYERIIPGDTALVFANWLSSDTVRSAGYNRNPMISSKVRWSPGPSSILIVWESNRSGRSHIYSRWTYLVLGDVKENPGVPVTPTLSQNYPNPFNPTTVIRYTIAGTRDQGLGASIVRLVVYDLLGREIAQLVNERQLPGSYEVRFKGERLASGMYFYRLTSGQFTAVRTMTLLK